MSLGQYLADKFMPGFGSAGVMGDELDVIIEDVELAPALSTRALRLNNGQARTALPMVSVVLRTRGRVLGETLDALQRQTYPADRYELVIVDDGSDAGRQRLLREFAGRAHCTVRIEVAPGLGNAAARNLGARSAVGDIVAHTDDDCRVPPGWLEAGVKGFDRNVGFVAGPIFPKPEQQISFLSFVRHQPTDNGVYAASNIFYRRKLFLEVGGFSEATTGKQGDATWGWDTATAWRLVRKGYQGRFRPEAHVYQHVHNYGLRPWLLEGWQARMLPLMLRDIPELRRSLLRMRLFSTRESMTFECGLLGVGLALARRRRAWLLLWLPWLGLALSSAQADWWPLYRWPKLPVKVSLMFARHLILIAGLIQGSVRARKPLL